jgi:adenosylcobinamide-phosphate synthase
MQSEAVEFCSGAALTLTIVGATYAFTRWAIRLARRRSTAIGNVVELVLGWTCLAAANLQHEATGVVHALAADNLPLARRRIARIVGRDTDALDTHDISRALIETLAESASDGIIAPVFYMSLGGVPLAMAYKAVNTLDSMIGHADQRYFYFGKFAARLDDAANLIPARLTAAAIACASGSGAASAVDTWLRDGSKHKSPNAGQPEAAMAGALRVQLGGENTYAGERILGQRLGAGFPAPSISDARRAVRIVSLVALMGVTVASAILFTVRGSRSPARSS